MSLKRVDLAHQDLKRRRAASLAGIRRSIMNRQIKPHRNCESKLARAEATLAECFISINQKKKQIRKKAVNASRWN